MYKKLSSLLLSLAIIVQLFPIGSVSAQSVSFDSYKSAIGNIRVYRDNVSGDLSLVSTGTGFFVSEEVMVTAAHVVLTGETVDSVSPYIAVSIPEDNYEDEEIGALANVIAVDVEKDIALLHVFPMPFDKEDLQLDFWNHYEFEVNSNEPSIGDNISVVGYPDLTSDITLTSGIISGTESTNGVKYYTSDVLASFGNSGGPVLNQQNQPVGIVTQISVSGQNNAQFTRVIPMKTVSSWINSHLANTTNYQVPSYFYERLQEINDSYTKESSVNQEVTVHSDFYPEFSYTLPSGYSGARVLGSNIYDVFKVGGDSKLSVIQIDVPIKPDNENIVRFLNSYLNAEIEDYSDANFAGLSGIKYVDGSDDNFVAIHKGFLTIVIVPSSDHSVLNSLNFSSSSFSSALQTQFTSVNDDYLDIQFNTPSQYYAYGAVSNLFVDSYYIYRQDNLVNPIFVNIYSDINDREGYLDQAEESLGFDDADFVEEYVTEYNRNRTVNGYKVWYTEYKDPVSWNELAIALVWDADQSRMIEISSGQVNIVDEINTVINSLSFDRTKTYTMTDTSGLFKKAISNNPEQTNQPANKVSNPTTTVSETRADLLGMILLQVEQHGEAWYIEPQSGSRIYMRDGTAAFSVMREYGLGITNANLNKIYTGNKPTDSNQCYGLANDLKGRVLLQVEENGEAWYIYPKNCRRYSLGRPDQAYEIMRFLGLGALDRDIEAIKQ